MLLGDAKLRCLDDKTGLYIYTEGSIYNIARNVSQFF